MKYVPLLVLLFLVGAAFTPLAASADPIRMSVPLLFDGSFFHPVAQHESVALVVMGGALLGLAAILRSGGGPKPL